MPHGDQSRPHADGVALLGGYNPVTWSRDVLANQTTIVGSNTTGGHPKTVSAAGVSGRFDGFTVVGENAGPGLNSCAVWVRDCSSSLEITNNNIIAGNGGRGGRGGRGAAPITSDDSVGGQPGAGCVDTQTPTCAGSAGAGGSGGILICDLVNVSGGNGGSTGCPNGCDAQAREVRAAPTAVPAARPAPPATTTSRTLHAPSARAATQTAAATAATGRTATREPRGTAAQPRLAA